MNKKISELGSLFVSFARIGSLTFGGGLAMLPMLKNEIVENKGWTTEEELLDYYAIGQCTPGVIAVNTATFIGYKRQGVLGAIAATVGMVMPSLIIIILIASILNGVLEYPVVAHALNGIRTVVCALMINTAIALAKKSLVSVFSAAVYVLVLAASLFAGVSSVLIIVIATVTGLIWGVIDGKKQKADEKNGEKR